MQWDKTVKVEKTSYISKMHCILTPFFLVALTSQIFANHPSDHEGLLPSTLRSSLQRDKSLVAVDLLRRSSRNDSSMFVASNNTTSAIHRLAKLIYH